ncbi:MtnX-like HAD-IB family phosphatase [Enterobacteriaceae bacterium H18W14]|uniref:MtnX-like HAD-IB family phosphatase n=1 Tax=Dryocola boscaweniae TaxID=2925397 RepID=UPI0022F047C2|nr:MtnX-like HAD-IB family phosphatase [Dryocola boscaweniae]MCT4715466.1 MtnX-like HAD-IB family phosphatase [Dryocola boscaweniae]
MLNDPGQQSDWIVQCDFDDTISLRDVTDTLLERFGLPGWDHLEQKWVNGEIGSLECMRGQVALLDMTPGQLEEQLCTIEIDPHFPAFVAAANRLGWPVQIVSDGLDWAIRAILARHGLGHLPVFANHLAQTAERQWKLEAPWHREGCIKASANCKCQLLKGQQQRKKRVLYVGDGSSDFCVSGKADMVLAKSALITHCQQQHIPHLRMNNFKDAIDLLQVVAVQHKREEAV